MLVVSRAADRITARTVPRTHPSGHVGDLFEWPINYAMLWEYRVLGPVVDDRRHLHMPAPYIWDVTMARLARVVVHFYVRSVLTSLHSAPLTPDFTVRKPRSATPCPQRCPSCCGLDRGKRIRCPRHL